MAQLATALSSSSLISFKFCLLAVKCHIPLRRLCRRPVANLFLLSWRGRSNLFATCFRPSKKLPACRGQNDPSNSDRNQGIRNRNRCFKLHIIVVIAVLLILLKYVLPLL